MRVLVITKIFPHAGDPTSAPFNRQQIAALVEHVESVEVLGTIPWYPGSGLLSRWSSAGKLAHVPSREVIDGIAVRHPRTLFIPRIAHGAWGPLYAASIAPLALAYRGKVDVVLGTWAYPDGAASIPIARLIGVPAVVKVHGSDMNTVAKLPGPRRWLRAMLPRAAGVVAVSRALGSEVRSLGVDEDRIHVIMNGVDAELFHPRDRAESRKELGLPCDPRERRRIILYVGNLKRDKGILDLAAAFDRIASRQPNIHLAVVGGGEGKGQLEDLAARHPGRVTLAGKRPLSEVPVWMGACDVLTLPSWAEGTPNVVMEALASGRRVVASSVGGIPDLITSPKVGQLVAAKDAQALATALQGAALEDYDPLEVARIGSRGSWSDSARLLANVLSAARTTRH